LERVNASWMLFKIVNCHPSTLFNNISILNTSLNDSNKEVIRNIGKVLEFLAYKDPEKISSSIPNIVNLLDSKDPQIKFTASLIFKAISRKYDKIIAIPKLAKLLDDENIKTQLNAINAIIELTDDYLDKIMEKLYRKLKDKSVQSEILEIIFKISSRYPEKIVTTLIPHLDNKDNDIRRFTLIFLNNLAGKNLDFLKISISKLISTLKDKVEKNRVMASNLLFKLSQDHADKFLQYIPELEDLLKKTKGKFRLNIASILINTNKFYPDKITCLPEINKRMEKYVKSSNFKISSMARINLSTIHKWNTDYDKAIKICQDLIKKYPLEENFKLLFHVAEIYHIIGDFKNAIYYFSGAMRSPDAYIKILSLIMMSYDFLLQNNYDNALNHLDKAINQYEKLNEMLSQKRNKKIKFMISYIQNLLKSNFNEARKVLTEIIELNNYKHPWEIRAQKNEIQNLKDIEK